MKTRLWKIVINENHISTRETMVRKEHFVCAETREEAKSIAQKKSVHFDRFVSSREVPDKNDEVLVALSR